MIMTSLKKFDNMLYTYWSTAIGKELPLPPEAKFVTGIAKNDAFLHHMLVEHGVEISLVNINRHTFKDPRWKISDYKIVDEAKYAWFLLRWE